MTQFGYSSHSSSPARRRIVEAGLAYQASVARAKADEERRLAEEALRHEQETVRQRRERLVHRLEEALERTKTRVKSMLDIAAVVADQHGVPVELVMSTSRNREATRARQEAYYHCRQAGRTDSEIGRVFGRDHTTIRYGIDAHRRRVEGV